ncbi:MAG TPA: sulfite exporter TauE/SafE family protein [Gammaproteobacteria bacterium]|nr:sulfite exporter TauE/SafE family protein [Gammaproteobacteria bacterium]
MDPWLWLGLFILLAYTVEAATGFGSIVIALSLGALFLPITELLPVLVPLNIIFSGYLCIRHRAHIQWPTLLRLILPLMALGTLFGYLLRPILGGAVLHSLFGVLLIVFATRQLWLMHRTAETEASRPSKQQALTLAAGITHGLYASGGPLLVYALASSTLAKAELRSTLITVWFTLNSLLTLIFLADGSLLSALPRLASYLPTIIIGIMAGEWLHHRINEQRFRQLVFMLLGVLGAILAVSA